MCIMAALLFFNCIWGQSIISEYFWSFTVLKLRLELEVENRKYYGNIIIQISWSTGNFPIRRPIKEVLTVCFRRWEERQIISWFSLNRKTLYVLLIMCQSKGKTNIWIVNTITSVKIFWAATFNDQSSLPDGYGPNWTLSTFVCPNLPAAPNVMVQETGSLKS